MSEIKAALFDADGVVIVPQMVFSRQYAEERGLDPDSFQAFFRGEFSDAITGEADLKDLIRKHNDIWQWDGDLDELLTMWFEAENATDPELVELIKQQRANGLPVYLATNQEKYRAKYLREVMFVDVFDDLFVSSEIGHMKREPEYWAAVLGKLALTMPGIQQDQIVYFDDSRDGIETAAQQGITAYLYEDVDQVKQVLKA